MTEVTVIIPYIYKEEIVELQQNLSTQIKILYREDTYRVGSDIMYQELWTDCAPNDIFIMHADMKPITENWLEKVKSYVKQYPEAGMFGCKLLYPATTIGKIIQSAGGKFENNAPAHFGSGLEMFTGIAWKELDFDMGQYNDVREVAWTTFGGVYIRRELLDQVGDFDNSYEWSYNRDVDYCLKARELGWKIYQIPVEINHFESKDNKRMREQNPEYNDMEQRNLKRLQDKWMNTKYYKTINRKINE